MTLRIQAPVSPTLSAPVSLAADVLKPEAVDSYAAVPATKAVAPVAEGAVAPYAADAPWPTFRGNVRNSGCNTELLVRGVPESAPVAMTVQRFRTGNAIFSTPIIGAGEMVYVGSADKKFYALDPKTGREAWSFATDEAIDSAAVIDDAQRLYVPSGDGRIYRLAPDGREEWRYDALKTPAGYSPSTIYWWEGNVTLGPSGKLYAGNDNFYVNAIDRSSGKRAWGTSTGLNVWSAPAFDARNLYVGSFDKRVYALDNTTGAVRWSVDTGDLIAASVAIGKNDRLYVGTFAGELLAIDKDTGKIRVRKHLGDSIYGSVAIADDGKIYCGTLDGKMYALDPETLEVSWSFDTGSPIRGSASIGPDPEKKAPYLVYFGAGNGSIYALDPSGARRWSFDTRTPGTEYADVNASIALGQYGLATASASGDVVYIPYRYYLTAATDIERRADDGLPREGAFLRPLTAGGNLVAAGDALPLSSAGTVSLDLLIRDKGQSVEGTLDESSVKVTVTPELAHRIALQPDGRQLNIVPLELPKPDTTYTFDVTASTTAGAQIRTQVAAHVAAVADAPPIEALIGLPFRVSHMSCYAPAIIPSFDQIGIASLAIDVRVVDADPATGKVSAWGVLKFGTDAKGDANGIPAARDLFFALSGRYSDGQLLLEAAQPWFEITACPVPLDKLRFACALPKAGAPVDSGSLLAEVRVPTLGEMSKDVLTGKPPAVLRVASKLASNNKRTWAQWFASWKWEHLTPQYLGSIAASTFRTARAALSLVRHPPAWGLTDASGRFTGVGTFRSTSIAEPGEKSESFGTLESVQLRNGGRSCEARIRVGEAFDPARQVGGLLLKDTSTGALLSLDYNAATSSAYDTESKILTIRVRAPSQLDAKSVKAFAMIDTVPVGAMMLT